MHRDTQDSGPDKSAYDATRAERDRRAHNLAQAQQPPNVTAPATPAADAAAAAAAATLADGKGTTVKGASLAPVLAHLVNLRAAVRTAVRLHAARLAAARQGEDAVSQVERAALVARHAALVDEVRTKNERVKVMIDHLRQLYRDSLSFRNNLNLNYPRNAMPPSTSKN